MHAIRRLGHHLGLSGGAASLSLLYFLYYGSGAAWLSFFNIYLRELGFSGSQIGLLGSVRPAAVLLGQPVWGVVGDLWGRRRTLLVTMTLASTLILGYAMGKTLLFFIVWTVLFTVLANPVGALIDSLVLDHLEERKELAFGQLRLWGAVGWAVCNALVGLAITGRDTRLIFVFAAIFGLAGLLVAVIATRGHESERATLQRGWSGLGELLSNRPLIIFLGVVTLVQTSASSIFAFYPVYLSELGASNRLVGLALMLQGIGELPLFLLSAVIIRRLGPAKTVLVAMCVFAIRMLLYSVIDRPMWAMLVELSHGLSFSLFLVASVEYINRVVPSAWRATGQSLFWAAYFGTGAILGSYWAGRLYDWLGVQMMFRVNGGLLLATLIVAVWALRQDLASHARQPSTESSAEQNAL